MDETGLFVLVIDDDVSVLTCVTRLLHSTGWRIAGVTDAEKGLELSCSALPDVVVCDVKMPNLSGPQFVQKLRANPATARIPVILMSGYPESYSQGTETSFLQKPFSSQELIETIRRAAKDAQTVTEGPVPLQ